MGLREAAADFENFNAQSGASKHQFDEQERLKTQQREAEIAKANLDILRAQADVGDRAAKLEIEKLEAAQKYRDLARELLAIMSNPAMSSDARSEASRQLGLLPMLQMLTTAGITDHRTLPTSLARLQTVSGSGGAAAAAMVGHDQEQMQLSAYHDPQQEVAKAVNDIAAKLKNIPTAKAIADALKEALSILGFTGIQDNDGSGSNLF